MFERLAELEYQRTPYQAVGFYLAYFLLSLIVFIIAGLALIPAGDGFDEEFEAGFALGGSLGPLYSIILGGLVVWQKKRWRQFSDIILVLVGGVGAVYFGTFLGLILVAYLTTREVLESP